MRAFTTLALLATFASATDPDVSSSFQKILSDTNGNALYNYPTDLTRGIIPVHPSSPLLCPVSSYTNQPPSSPTEIYPLPQ